MALDDDLIRRNPFEFELATVIVNDSVTREAITREQERKYLEFVKNDAHLKDIMKESLFYSKPDLESPSL